MTVSYTHLKRGIYEYLIDRCYAGEEPPAYNTLTKWMRRNGIECGRPCLLYTSRCV